MVARFRNISRNLPWCTEWVRDAHVPAVLPAVEDGPPEWVRDLPDNAASLGAAGAETLEAPMCHVPAVSPAVEDSAPTDSSSDDSKHAVVHLRAKRAKLDQRIAKMQQERDCMSREIDAALLEKKRQKKTTSAHQWPEEEDGASSEEGTLATPDAMVSQQQRASPQLLVALGVASLPLFPQLAHGTPNSFHVDVAAEQAF